MGIVENLGKDRIVLKHDGKVHEIYLTETWGDNFRITTVEGKRFRLKKIKPYLAQKMFREGHGKWMEFEEENT